MNWCISNPETLFAHHQDRQRFLAIHPDHGVVISAEDEDTFEAKLADRRPSVLRELYLTHTSLWVQEGKA